LESLARPWTLHILWALSTQGPARFGALQKQVAGISSRVLAERLRMLEEKEFVFRHYAQTIPPAVTYGISKRMQDIEKVLQDLERLARKWNREESASPRRLRPRPPGQGASAAGPPFRPSRARPLRSGRPEKPVPPISGTRTGTILQR
jgi:DNA-binding HxlR family transcriptional regulator